jgi:hypothetical protein
MSSAAILMMLLAMVVLWGGLGLAILNLNRSDKGEVQEPRRDL